MNSTLKFGQTDQSPNENPSPLPKNKNQRHLQKLKAEIFIQARLMIIKIYILFMKESCSYLTMSPS